VELRALNSITLSPDFNVASNGTFQAYIVTEGGNYRYDAIGNLLEDQEKQVKVTWTPQGKVRTVDVQTGTTLTSYRYDGMGNRIEKKVTQSGTTVTTRYLRDASGNVLAVYTDNTLTEQPLYGSSRLGQYNGGAQEGKLILGLRRYELNNHLGNVLTVVTDKVGMDTGTVFATVESTNDYYPFGLAMVGRSWKDPASNYRYGFNGKEKDSFNATVYDYGFRIYNPEIGRFLSVDPLTKSYPWYTPYQFAGNTPIRAIDVDGLEPAMVFGSGNQTESIKNTKGNVNYVGVELISLNQAYQEIVNHKSKGNKIEVLYFQTHGTPGSLYIIEGQNKKLNTTPVSDNRPVLDDDEPVTGGDIEEYFNQKRQLTEEKFQQEHSGNSKFQAIIKFKEIASLTEENATIILGGCEIAKNFSEFKYFGGDELATQLQILTGRTVILNQDATNDLVRGSFLDQPRTSEKYFKNGFTMGTTVFDGKIFKTGLIKDGQNLRLNSRGAFYDFIPHYKK